MDAYASADVPPVVAAFVIALSVAMLIAGIAISFWRGSRRAAVAARAESSIGDEEHPLVEGKDVVLSGIVRHLEGHEVAVKVSIEQRGSEAESSGTWSHSWVEIDRDIVVAPFLLELPNGQHVRVDPPKNVDVADALDQKVWIDRNTRVLSAELVPGERIFARGRLERSDIAAPGGAYRDVAWGWALGPSDGQMLLSSEPLGEGLRTRARFHRRFGMYALAILVATQTSLVWFYNRVAGETVIAEVENRRFYQTTDSDGDTHDHYIITFTPDTDVTDRTVDIDDDDYEYLDRGSKVPLRRANASNWNLGAEPTLAIWHSIAIFFLPFVFWITYSVRRGMSRPWFRRKVNEDGPGRLPDAG